MSTRPARQFVVPALSLMLAAGVFVLDLATPLGIPVGLLYFAPILLLYWAPSKVLPVIMAVLCSILVGIGLYLSPPGVPFSHALMNRLIGLVPLWTAAIAVSSASEADPKSGRLIFGISRQTVVNLASLGLVFTLLGVATCREIVASREVTQFVVHNHEILDELSLTLSTLTDAETGQREFLLTGEDHYLEPYRRAVAEVHGHVARLTDLTRNNPVQQDRLPALTQAVEAKLIELDETIRTRRIQRPEAALRIVTTDQGKAIMDDVRRRTAEMEKTERDLLGQRQQQAQLFFLSQVAMLLLGGFIFVGLMAFTVVLLRQEQAKQREIAAGMRMTLATLEATRDGIFIFDPRTLRFTYVNEGAVRQMGYSRAELLRMTPLDIEPEFDEPRFRAMIEPLVNGMQSVCSVTTVHRRKDGIDVPVEINLQAVDEGMVQCRLIAAARDITERQHAEDAQRRLAAIVEWTDDAIIGKTLNAVITSWNKGAERLYGYKAEEIIGKSLRLLVPQDRWGEELEIIDRIRRGQQIQHFENVRQTKDGRLIDISLTASPIKDGHGHIVGVSGIGRDITERRRVEGELKRRGSLLEAANKELEAFSYSVSHDLLAPLRSLDGFSLALMEDSADRLDEQGKDYLKRIRAASHRMGRLVDDLLNLSRTTRAELRLELVDLTALATNRAEEVRKLWPGRQVELIVEPGLKAEGDRQLLGIMFDNLLDNAWKFTSKRERAVIKVGVERRENETVYFVRDNGAGFDMAYAGKLFGAFQRLHTVTEYPGTGIGLATVQRIVHRHGGRVWAEGVVEKGATVFFTLMDRLTPG